jgi:ADP-dependent NAD(P)H-hydrate dehydratase / NAD(P)H-hydrate epimerase
MKVFSAAQLKAWDAYTIEHEPVSSLDLMERAAEACSAWITQHIPLTNQSVFVFCGKGNNGGDGLAIARLLLEKNIPVAVYILEFGHKGTDEFQVNLERLHGHTPALHFIQTEAAFPLLPDNVLLIDALQGLGINRPLDGLTASLVHYLNGHTRTVVAIDLPSGLRTDESSQGGPVIRATHTLTLGAYKLGLLMAENAPSFGDVHLLPIGLDEAYGSETFSPLELTDLASIKKIFKPRTPFANKGNFGHALIAAGSEGKMGACVLSSRACLRSGVGLVTSLLPPDFLTILQVTAPEAMAMTDPFLVDPTSYKAFGIGPGLGTEGAALDKIGHLLEIASFPVVLDADGLNLLSKNPVLWDKLPPYSILTPHPKEFERLFGPSADGFRQLKKALEQAAARHCYIVLKGHRTFIACPDGSGFFNTTGNVGMATGGSGDVLTGILTGILAQGYTPLHAAVLGVYLHGLAGDLALAQQSTESLLAGDIVDSLGAAFRYIAA